MKRVPLILSALAVLAALPALADAKIHGSIQLPAAAESGKETQADRLKEDRALASKARITKEQAIAAAQAVAKGPIKGALLDDEDGSLVYNVEIGDREVLVDAGTGKVLANEKAD